MFYSTDYSIDRQYKSMEGPYEVQDVVLHESEEPELLWITSIDVTIVGPSDEPRADDFLCHVNLDYDPVAHRQRFNWQKYVTSRMFSLSQGQLNITFPDGFGLPVMSDEAVKLTTQVLNHNRPTIDIQVHHKVTVEYIVDGESYQPLRPLFAASVFGMKLLEGPDGFYGVAPEQAHPGTSCLPGEHAKHGTSTGIFGDQYERKFSGHWTVKPGVEVNHTFVTEQLNLPFNTTLHYAAIHLHPFAEWMEMRDITTNKVVFRTRARGIETGIGLSHVDTYSSKDGIPLYRDHDYEVVTSYNNTSGVDQDAMATMFLYLLDREFIRADVR